MKQDWWKKTHWIQTHSGLRFEVLDPKPEMIVIEDIAHALSMNCRFNGHCKDFYSVAEHSVYVSRFLDHDPHLALWGLLHDASEAYITDLPRPVKNAIPEFVEIEERFLQVMAAKFNLSYPMPDEVSNADLRMIWTEKGQVLFTDLEWTQTEFVEPFDFEIQFWNPRTAKMVFLEVFRLLRKAYDDSRGKQDEWSKIEKDAYHTHLAETYGGHKDNYRDE